jgi:hypothetical protein
LATFIFPDCYNKEYQPKNLHITLPTTTTITTTEAAVVLLNKNKIVIFFCLTINQSINCNLRALETKQKHLYTKNKS